MARIVVIRDARASRELLSHLLREGGWEVVTCCGAQSSYRALRASKPALIILDMRVRGTDVAWHLLTLVHLDPELRSTPVILCAPTSDDLLAREEWLHNHNVSIVRKPFDLDELHTAIESVLAPSVRRA